MHDHDAMELMAKRIEELEAALSQTLDNWAGEFFEHNQGDARLEDYDGWEGKEYKELKAVLNCG